ncbi:hypothetical protein P153DRAFT_145741 [Dothidotthia symphoricarpi CBS 119687]|uniref:Uncharacterized protein n=1 Tax=Dothidotthia symphoricarpi CBS 119687 TaxID=1392245 RepID=A0A6A5ZZL0_9PLEO|nr:uncharacterized protein P153DRAFT_145741 [Dothidotthia symphoricarpi CBS 119687]KAF2123761.1 hypothetical protein P153DRAFT_145741 [Dothidotthia symphoricarpi CBS 119687]
MESIPTETKRWIINKLNKEKGLPFKELATPPGGHSFWDEWATEIDESLPEGLISRLLDATPPDIASSSSPLSPPPPPASSPTAQTNTKKRKKKKKSKSQKKKEMKQRALPAKATRAAVARGEVSPLQLKKFFGNDGRAEERIERIGEDLARGRERPVFER